MSIRKKIRSCLDELQAAVSEQKEIDRILARKQGKLKVKDIINIEGKKSLLKHLNSESETLKIELGEIEKNQSELKGLMDQFDNPKRRKEIIAEYGKRFRRNASMLSVTGLSEHVFKNIDASIDESGSDLPRAVLAYYFTIISLIVENNGNVEFPMIIDAPNQQKQDKDNLYNILNFVLMNKPSTNQIIIGLVDDAGIQFPGTKISFDTKYSVLKSSNYINLSKEIRFYEAAHLSGKAESRRMR